MVVTNESEILAAFRLLFSPDGGNLGRALESVHASEVKSAFRKMALRTHPDRFASRGEDYQKICSERFIRISSAYELLIRYLKLREEGLCSIGAGAASGVHPGEHRGPARRARRPQTHYRERDWSYATHSLWQKDVPHRHLRFGEFLYYSGAIPWKFLIKALVWQSSQRPRIGEIAQRWRWLTEMQIAELLRNRRPGERVGEILLHNGLLTPFQLNVLLSHQRRIQRPIGEFFILQKILARQDIRDFLRRQERHNMLHGSASIKFA